MSDYKQMTDDDILVEFGMALKDLHANKNLDSADLAVSLNNELDYRLRTRKEALETAREFEQIYTARLAHPAICKDCDPDNMKYCEDYYDGLLMLEVAAYKAFLKALNNGRDNGNEI